ncbi:master DNA invertase Mpi family serine-type recombinase [Enterococcus hulanensis]|uniref:master DNA invertase Mpi family serine-type recombinase n=1 Tax=Enterococcus hulanensis TaxID=2559929 RepID=UPI00288E2D12|nr:master DNA invertase Mpi family serine-type recombinase [Enterococcus hulanensis]MDT2661213.1 master DNA invertase Mpi family serine-type recombinase [Enterococcus hulanensis]
MIYGYIRVSTDKQTVENQRFEIKSFCKARQIEVDKWIEETISARKKLEERKFGRLMKKLKNGDIIIVSELSRLGRNLLQIMSILNDCMERNIQVLTVKEGYELGNNINSKVLAFAFGLSAEIEKNLISERTKEALARKKSEGVILGRPKGKKSDITKMKLYRHRKAISRKHEEGMTYSELSRVYKVHRITVSSFIKRLKEEEICLNRNIENQNQVIE